MWTKCGQNVCNMLTKCGQNAEKMWTQCGENVEKCGQHVGTLWNAVCNQRKQMKTNENQ